MFTLAKAFMDWLWIELKAADSIGSEWVWKACYVGAAVKVYPVASPERIGVSEMSEGN